VGRLVDDERDRSWTKKSANEVEWKVELKPDQEKR
jgi:hypothetical protein